MDLREAGAVDPRAHWYYRSKLRPLLAFAAAGGPTTELVDIGAGTGFFSEQTASALSPRPRLIQVDTGYEREDDRRRRALPAKIGPNALVLMMDVLEHCEDDAAELSAVVSRCARPCRFFLTVPAFASMWSPHDEFLGHKRRYRLMELESLARGAGLEIRSAYYFFGLALIPAWLKRRLFPAAGSELKALPRPVEALLEGLCTLELPLRRANRMGGLTCVVEATLP